SRRDAFPFMSELAGQDWAHAQPRNSGSGKARPAMADVQPKSELAAPHRPRRFSYMGCVEDEYKEKPKSWLIAVGKEASLGAVSTFKRNVCPHSGIQDPPASSGNLARH